MKGPIRNSVGWISDPVTGALSGYLDAMGKEQKIKFSTSYLVKLAVAGTIIDLGDWSAFDFVRLSGRVEGSSALVAALRFNGDAGANYTFQSLDIANSANFSTGPINKYTVALTPVAVAANSIVEQTFTVTGLGAASQVSVTKPSAQAGLGIVGARVTGANTLGITYINITGAPITPTAETYLISETTASVVFSGLNVQTSSAQTYAALTALVSEETTFQAQIFCIPSASSNKVLLQSQAAEVAATPELHQYSGWWASAARVTSAQIINPFGFNFSTASEVLVEGYAA